MISALHSTLVPVAKHSDGSVEILVRSEDVQPFVNTIRSSADREKDALGFLPEQAYETAARSGHLYVASQRKNQKLIYLGHIFFGASFPHARIHQIYVMPDARKLGVAQKLIESFVAYAEKHSYMDITAKVASDLPANPFWEKMGFTVTRTQPGGSTRNRTINVRVKQLNTPTLFGYPDGEPVSGLPTLAHQMAGHTPVYLIDLNVFFDITKRRARGEQAAQIISAALDNVIRIVVAEEFTTELKRSYQPGTPDPVLEFALQLPTVSSPEQQKRDSLTSELAGIVFPDRAKNNALSVQDDSDLIHLATAIHHSASGFVTAENALVQASNVLEIRYGIKIVHVEHFARLLQSAKHRIKTVDARFAENELRLSELTPSLHNDALSLIEKISISNDMKQHITAHGVHSSHNRSIAISVGGKLLCTALWNCSTMLQQHFAVTVIADEDQPAIESALDALFLAISYEAIANGPSLIELTIPRAHLVSKEMALTHGFVPKQSASSDVDCYLRLAIGHAVTEKLWESARQNIARITGNTFPESLPTLSSSNVKLAFTSKEGKKHQISLEDFETALSPIVLCRNARTSTLVPIRRNFADHLLNTSFQGSLLPKSAAGLFHERVYYSSPRNASLLVSGSAMLFYESGKDRGRSAVVAIARVRETTKVSKREVASSLLRHGVLEAKEIAMRSATSEVAATVFDNLLCFRKPVPLKILRDLRCVDGANLIRAKKISTDQLQAIIEQGE